MSGANRHDAIVIGAGHNGLVTACYLARAGLDVLVLERNPWFGGATVSRSLYPGFTYSNCSYVCSLLRTEIIRGLDLPAHGLQIIPYEGGCTMMRDGGHLALYDNHDALRRELARHSRRDAEAYDRYVRDMLRHCRFIKPLLLRTPPDPTSFRPRDLQELLWLGRHFHGLGEARMYDTLRFWTQSCADLLDEYFESEIVKAHLAGSSIIGTALGPRSPGTAYVLLHHYMGSIDGTVGAWGFARGGMGAVSKALAASLEASGGRVRCDAAVERVLVRRGRATGVVLAGGEEISAPVVVSNMDVKRTFLETVDAEHLPPQFLRQVKRFKIRGSSGKLNIALDGLPHFPAIPAGSPCIRGDLHITDTIDMLERAYDDWKAGRWSRAPYVDMLIPSQIDPTMAPQGKHYMSVFVQYCPYRLADGEWTEDKRQAFGATVIEAIARHSPNFRDLILHAEIRTPHELESEVGLTEGNIFQGELTFDQLLFNRPVPGYAQYRAPLKGMYMCGSSTHPGGGVMGAPGANAAGAILQDLRLGRELRLQ
ncbi:MAG TPA: NAD(P)/FAD-dependent oxidoreductase [Steroidobacteraceae bacterium]|jgi:phytoene dehydrogenase-like protein|nr:NAD(P)/FAD-dependent oxidoreductase [Steroidobacteraceae bacterium]